MRFQRIETQMAAVRIFCSQYPSDAPGKHRGMANPVRFQVVAGCSARRRQTSVRTASSAALSASSGVAAVTA